MNSLIITQMYLNFNSVEYN